MKHDVGAAAAAAGLLAFVLTGCATVPEPDPSGAAIVLGASGTGLAVSTVAYVRSVCDLPKEQREPAVRELNESLVPNHAVIYCGRSGTP